jgi:Zn-dependent protease with chaperone function
MAGQLARQRDTPAHAAGPWALAAFDPDAAIQPATVEPGRQRQARRYARERQLLSLLNLAVSALPIAVLLFTPLGFRLRDALAPLAVPEPVPGWQPLRIAAYFAVLFAAGFVLTLPISYYAGFVLGHRYQLSTQTLGGWALDRVKMLCLSLVFELAAVEFIYLLLAHFPDSWWLWAGLAALVFTALLANLAPVLIFPLFAKLTPLPEGDVRRRALALAARARTPVRGIYAMDASKRTTAANAMVMGLGNTRRIVVTDTLLAHFTPEEIEVVVAHELGHQVHGDMLKLIVVETATTLGGLFVVNLVLHAVVAGVPGYHGLADVATMPLSAAALGVFALVVLPITNGFSRLIEHQADVYALETTRNAPAFIGAMTRLADRNLAELEPARIVEVLLYNHPALGRRLAYARRFLAEQGAGAA